MRLIPRLPRGVRKNIRRSPDPKTARQAAWRRMESALQAKVSKLLGEESLMDSKERLRERLRKIKKGAKKARIVGSMIRVYDARIPEMEKEARIARDNWGRGEEYLVTVQLAEERAAAAKRKRNYLKDQLGKRG